MNNKEQGIKKVAIYIYVFVYMHICMLVFVYMCVYTYIILKREETLEREI